MKEHNIHIKEIDSDRFEIEKDDVKSPTEGKWTVKCSGYEVIICHFINIFVVYKYSVIVC